MLTEQFKITGMTCGGCISNVKNALNAVSGVDNVQVSLASGEAKVQYDQGLTSPDQLKSAVKRVGYGIDGTNDSRVKGGCCC